MQIDPKTALYLEFLQFSINENVPVPQSIEKMDWEGLFQFGVEQTIVGVLFHGIEKLKDHSHKPSVVHIGRFYAYYQRIAALNKQVFQDADSLTRGFKKKFGVDTCVMKGQANALLYPDPYMRTPGDIDLWVDAKPTEIIQMARTFDANAEIGYHHIQTKCAKTPVELHFFPSFMGNLFYEYRLRKYFNKHKDEQFRNSQALPDNLGQINVLTPAFDRVFQLSHLMHHFFFEGIGFRQMIDYYYLLKAGLTNEEKTETQQIIQHVNMKKFAQAVMFIMQDVFGLEEKYLLFAPNKRIGEMLKNEILQSGNFGFHDQRYTFGGKSVYSQYLLEIYRNLHFALDFPSETVWGRPVSRWWHMFYKAWLRRQTFKHTSTQP